MKAQGSQGCGCIAREKEASNKEGWVNSSCPTLPNAHVLGHKMGPKDPDGDGRTLPYPFLVREATVGCRRA